MKPGENSGGWRTLVVRLVVTGVVLAIWFWTQSLLGARTPPVSGGIGDALHDLTAGLNTYFAQNAAAANALLIVSSAIIDALGVFLLGSWLFGGSVRPFLGLVLLMLLRQFLQALCSLPVPAGMIWHYPGFPSLLVTYHVATDFFFSGHTAIAVFAAIELSRFHASGSRSRPFYWSHLRSLRFSSCAPTTPWTFSVESSQLCGSPASADVFLRLSTAAWQQTPSFPFVLRLTGGFEAASFSRTASGGSHSCRFGAFGRGKRK